MKELEYPFITSALPKEEGGGYLIEFPDLPGCISDGETIEEAIENGKDAIVCWIETAKQHESDPRLSQLVKRVVAGEEVIIGSEFIKSRSKKD